MTLQDGLGGDTCQRAVGDGDRLANGRMDGGSGTVTDSQGNGSVIRGYHYEHTTGNDCQQMLS